MGYGGETIFVSADPASIPVTPTRSVEHTQEELDSRTIYPADISGKNPTARTITTPVAGPDKVMSGPSLSGNRTGYTGLLPDIFTNPSGIIPVALCIIVVIGLIIAADYLNIRNRK
jgi:hypothetical protein